MRYGDLYTQYQFLIRHSRAGIAESNISNYCQLRYGDVLFAGSGETIDEIGKSAVNLMEDRAYCGGDVIVFRPGIPTDATFLGYATDCRPAAYQKSCMGRGVTIMHIYSSELKQMLIPIPPLHEQQAIAAFLDERTERIDRLSSLVEAAIERLQEYRTALVTAAVTGKIDVREPMTAGAQSARMPSVRRSFRMDLNTTAERCAADGEVRSTSGGESPVPEHPFRSSLPNEVSDKPRGRSLPNTTADKPEDHSLPNTTADRPRDYSPPNTAADKLQDHGLPDEAADKPQNQITLTARGQSA